MGASSKSQIIKRRFRVRAEKYQMTGGTGSLRYMAPEVGGYSGSCTIRSEAVAPGRSAVRRRRPFKK